MDDLKNERLFVAKATQAFLAAGGRIRVITPDVYAKYLTRHARAAHETACSRQQSLRARLSHRGNRAAKKGLMM